MSWIQRIKDDFLFGLKLPLVAGRLILRHRSLFFLSLLPLLLTTFLYVYVLAGAQSWASQEIRTMLAAWGWNHEGWISWFIRILSEIVILTAGILTFTFTSTILATPFNDFLAERSERYATPPLPPALASGWRAMIRNILIDLIKTLATAIVAIFAFALSWIPVLNVLALILSLLLISFQYLSYPQTRRGIGMIVGSRFLFQHFWACLGFGAAISFIYLIPFISILGLPIAVVGGTLLFSTKHQLKK